MTTWIDSQDPELVRTAIADLAARNELVWRLGAAHGRVRYAVWLALVDAHTARLFGTCRADDWDWEVAYEEGISPRTAAISSYVDHLSTGEPRGSGLQGALFSTTGPDLPQLQRWDRPAHHPDDRSGSCWRAKLDISWRPGDTAPEGTPEWRRPGGQEPRLV